MYVCICNAVTEDDVLGCMAGGACVTTRDVKAACGMKPGCGSCTKRLHAMVSAYRTASDFADAPHTAQWPESVSKELLRAAAAAATAEGLLAAGAHQTDARR
ncbi:(2Fe-2S)-binding protein, partial [Actinomadura rubrisoli]